VDRFSPSFSLILFVEHAKDGLAVTAADGKLSQNELAERLERACCAAAAGRRAARALAEWAKPFGLTEAEFQMLWRLRPTSTPGPNQSSLAGELSFSPAQVSAVVERLRQRDLIRECPATGDRRQHHWQLSAAGQILVNRMLADASSLQFDSNPRTGIGEGANCRREAAA
jgi:DNA-binding MarR family transcriptional regulator